MIQSSEALLTESLIAALSSRDPETAYHSQRVQQFALNLGRSMHVPGHVLFAINTASLLHDIGKLATPDAILRKPETLTENERETMHRHPVTGADLLCSLNFPQAVYQIVEQHHEHWDGSGYPYGAAGEQISVGARIVAVVDSYDAMTRPRPYDDSNKTREQARDEIVRCSGSQFDPNVVRAFLNLTTSRSHDQSRTHHSPRGLGA